MNDTDGKLYRDITIGEVVDTNDPQQMGRVRVLCHAMGDDTKALMKNIPWATAMTPLGGITETTARGRSGHKSSGPVAYGMWNVPKVGSHVLVACIDGDTRFRVWLGCIHPQFMTHTLPHGRYISNGMDTLRGPFTSADNPIEPIISHQRLHFSPEKPSKLVVGSPIGEEYTKAPEYASRGADYSAASIRDEFINLAESGLTNVGDDNFEDVINEVDGNEVNHHNGYKESQVVTNIGFKSTDGKNYDPQVYSWTTPGFHSIAMDDSENNCRVRLRTTHGNQIILDDTNERIYISTPSGKTWIELDEKGNLDVYASRNISYHAEKNINFTADDTIRFTAGKGIHFESDDEIRLHNKGEQGGDFHIRSETNIRQHAVINTHVESDGQIHIKSNGIIAIQTGSVLHITAPKNTISGPTSIDSTLDVGGSTTVASIIANTSSIAGPTESDGGLNVGGGGSPNAPGAVPAIQAEEFQAFYTSRVPEHEPWMRGVTDPLKTDMDINNTHIDAAEFPYNSPKAGREERGEVIPRNENWHR